MTPVNAAALIICICAFGIQWKRITSAKLLVFFLLFLYHLAACYYYYLWSKTATADATIYYYDIYSLGVGPWALGPVFVVKFCTLLKHLFDATYLDCFLLFQSFSFVGLMLVARIFDEVQELVGVPERGGPLALLFLPSANFWPSAIGKDAPLFLGISLSLWAMLNLRRRIAYFCIGLGVMVLFRAHVAFMATSALAVAALFGAKTTFGQKLGLFGIAAVGVWITSGAVESSLGVDTTSFTSIAGFIDKHNSVFATTGGTTAVVNASFPVKLLSLMFRPFFFDAGGMMGVIASVENIGVLIAFIYVLVNWRLLFQMARVVIFIRFAIAFTAILFLALTILYYNVGLGLRERVMAYPMAFSLIVALWAVRRKQAEANVRSDLSWPSAQANPNRVVPEY